MTELFDELAIVGDPLDDENKVVHLLASLPNSYDMLVTALEASPQVPKIEVVTERLIHEETKKTQNDDIAMTLRHNRRELETGPECYYCGKRGHIKRNCRSYKSSLEGNELENNEGRPRSSTKQNACPATEESEEEFIGLFMKQTATEVKTNWIINSGASCHMSYDESLFSEMKRLDEPKEITVGDGSKVKAIGKGTLDLLMKLPNGKTNHCRLSDVLYVPKLSYNLFSVASTTRRGKRIEFEDSICKVLSKDRKLIAIGRKRENLYYLNCAQQSKGTNVATLCKLEESKRIGYDGIREETSFPSGKQQRTLYQKTGGERANVLVGEERPDVCHGVKSRNQPKSSRRDKFTLRYRDVIFHTNAEAGQEPTRGTVGNKWQFEKRHRKKHRRKPGPLQGKGSCRDRFCELKDMIGIHDLKDCE